MIDNLSFHTDRDLPSELATLQREIRSLTARVTTNAFSTYEDRWNTQARLDNLNRRAYLLEQEVALEAEEMARLEAGIRAAGDIDLGFLAYLVYGPDALPMDTVYEIRVIERRGGYTVPGTVRRNVKPGDVTETQRGLLADVMRRGGHAALWGHTIRDYRTQVTPY